MTLTLGSRSRLAAAMAALALVAAACGSGDDDGSDAAADDDSPIVAYALLGESGAYAPSAIPLIAGLKAAVAEINDHGGLLGREVTLEIGNTQSDPTKAVGLLTDRLSKQKPDVIFTGASSVEGLPMLPLTTRDKVISVSASSAAAFGVPSESPYSFSVAPTETTLAQTLLKAVQEKGYKRIAFIGSDTPTADGYIGAFDEAFTDAGLEIVGTETYAPDAVDVSGQLSRLKDENPDVVIASGTATTQYVLKSRLKVGMEDVPFIGDTSAHIIDLSNALSDDEKQGYEGMTTKANIPGKGGVGKEALQKHLTDQNFQYTTGIGVSGLAYDALMGWANGVAAADSVDPDDVKKAMESDPDLEFGYSLFDDRGTGWTADTHFTLTDAVYELIGVYPLADGQYQVP